MFLPYEVYCELKYIIKQHRLKVNKQEYLGGIIITTRESVIIIFKYFW